MLFHEHSAPRVSRRSGMFPARSPGRASENRARFRRNPVNLSLTSHGSGRGCEDCEQALAGVGGAQVTILLRNASHAAKKLQSTCVSHRHSFVTPISPNGGLVARDGIEPPTPAFSGLRSTS